MRRLLVPFLIAAASWWLWSQSAPIYRPPGVLIRAEPEQTVLSSPQAEITLKGWKVKPLALYKIDARVLSRKSYAGDPGGDIAPYDVAVGWGPMSDSRVLERIDIDQRMRFYAWRCSGDLPVPRGEIVSHSCNMHLIPFSDSIAEQIARLRPGSLISLRGHLVELTDPKDGGKWYSSLSRTDAGDGACEVMLVRSLTERD